MQKLIPSTVEICQNRRVTAWLTMEPDAIAGIRQDFQANGSEIVAPGGTQYQPAHGMGVWVGPAGTEAVTP